MKRALLLSLLLVACRQVAGIHTITYQQGTGDGGGGGCTNGTKVVTSSDSLDLLTVAGGYVLTAVPDVNSASGTGYTNIHACTTTTPCTQPPNLITLGFNDTIGGYAAASNIVYTVLTNPTSGAGSVHSVGFDGSNDQVLLGTANFPVWVTLSGTRTFWVSDDLTGSPASLHCIGCGGAGDQTWISNLTLTIGAFSDANNVYVVADDGSASGGSYGIFSCSTQTACGTSPKTLVKGLSINAITSNAITATDGTFVYLSNESSAIERIPSTGSPTTIVSGVATSAIAVDPATGEIFYGTETGTIAKAKSDGTGSPTTLSTCTLSDPGDIFGVAFDATNVYVLVSPASGGSSTVWAIKRN